MELFYFQDLLGQRITGISRCIEVDESLELQVARVLRKEKGMNCTREESRPARVVVVVSPEVVGQFNRMGETGVMQEEITSFPALSGVASRKPASVAVSRIPVKKDNAQRWKSRCSSPVAAVCSIK